MSALLRTPRGQDLWPFLPALMVIEAAGFPAPWSAAQLQEEADHPEGSVAILCTEGRLSVLAFCCTRQLYDELHLLQIATHPDARRQGHAARLLRHAADQAQQRGCRQIVLEVEASNSPALRLYQAHGFTPIGRRRGYYPDGSDALVLGCPVTGAENSKSPGRS